MRAEPRVLVFGGGGQVGRALARCDRPGRLRIVTHPRTMTDVTDRTAVATAIATLRPAVVVNAAAFTAVDQAEREPDRCFAVNRDGAGTVAGACAGADVPLIHLSTDYVFDGTKSAPYREYDAPSPINVYGASKAAGEVLVRAASRRHVILRTAWVFGPDGRNFARTVLRLAESGRPLRMVADQFGSPTPASALAEAIAAMAARIIAGEAAWGIFHLGGEPATSWHGFAQAIVSATLPPGLAPPVLAIGSADFPTPARRPRQSVLSCGRILAAYGITPPDWREALPRSLADPAGLQAPHISAIRLS
jgi:dTDP-4-dehydrorhamnose reductase